jgi:hypothetical protein
LPLPIKFISKKDKSWDLLTWELLTNKKNRKDRT